MARTEKLCQEFDLIVIGSGSAGSSAAEIAHYQGRSVVIVEKDKVGGDCPNYACVPTKALLRSAKVYSLLKRAEEFGLRTGTVGFDWAQVLARKDWIIRHTGAAGAEQRYHQEGITLLKGEASFEDEHHIRVNGQVLRGEKILIATGSKPQLPHINGTDQVKFMTNMNAISLSTLPKSMIIIGAGPVGCEFAQLFSTFDVQITLLQRSNHILPREEPDLSEIVQQALEKNGVTVVTNVEAHQLEQAGQRKRVRASVEGQEREFEAEEILMATGRAPQIDALNLAAVQVETQEKGQLHINEFLQTSQPHIFAAGDVTGPFLYTHFAHYQGNLAGQNMFDGEMQQADYRVVPRVTFTDPEIASVGLTEEEARQAGHKVVSGNFKIGTLGKALVESEYTGIL